MVVYPKMRGSSLVLDFHPYRNMYLWEMIWTGSIVSRVQVSEIETSTLNHKERRLFVSSKDRITRINL